MMIEVLKSHGWVYLRECNCASPGSIYTKGRNKCTAYKNKPKFLLERVGRHRTAGNAEDIEMVLNKYGL